ncbi:MAG: UMP kinase [Candidatus Micrarchaeota archaeon]|nr:UMP kinase [Candidatus Micrarchaeota archaeon]
MTVLSIGGSIINKNGIIQIDYLKRLGKLLAEYHLGIVVGGGFSARVYANAMKLLSNNEFLADECAILSTRQNAMLLIAAIGKNAYPNAVNSFAKAREIYFSNKTVVMYGTIPGITTDTDSVLLAEAIGAKKLINVSIIDGIYDKNPKEHKNARKLKALTHDELIELANKYDNRTAGTNFVFDSVAAKIAKRSNIELHFVSEDTNEIKKALDNKLHSGSVVKSNLGKLTE